MNWNWFPLNAGAAIQGRLSRRAALDSIEISIKDELERHGAIDDYRSRQARLLAAEYDTRR